MIVVMATITMIAMLITIATVIMTTIAIMTSNCIAMDTSPAVTAIVTARLMPHDKHEDRQNDGKAKRDHHTMHNNAC
jgi:beta-lactam-binding protein with PASTA domain